ncbi:DUF4124 domain-containing protein [Aliikangiella marina]|uniref:DUF4124 domain-containing protein n=1 Tax=Aliikangiella marina TaxID=1712262 RepID=A0A545T2Y8_9GAMM|nr:DUF4124 domain-containing protein [Aliikangiella marina]TQV71587.1 DUF4124 domain-containing protein [Aliikangiella marina]
MFYRKTPQMTAPSAQHSISSCNAFSRFFCLTLLFFFAASLKSAELYKWKDENGTVHYSEKPPENHSAETLILDQSSSFKPIPVASPVPVKSNDTIRHLLLVSPENFWNNANNQLKITYYFGGDCVSPTTKAIQNIKRNHKFLLPSYNAVGIAASTVFRQLNYPITTTNKSINSLNLSKFNDSLLLYIEPVSLDYDVCAKQIKQKYRGNKGISLSASPDDFSSANFKNRRAVISLKWTIIDARSKQQIFQGTTFGSANHWNQDNADVRIKTIRQAIQNATTNLLADENLINKVRSRGPSLEVPSKDLLGEITETLSDKLVPNAMKKAHFANILVKTAPLKSMVVEYYMLEGRWPATPSLIGLNPKALTDSYIDAIEFDVDGTIIVSVNEKHFSKPGVILLKPQESLGGINIEWVCLSDLDERFYGHQCNAL